MSFSNFDHAIYSEEAGCFISSKMQRFGEILQDYDPGLELRWIPPNMRSDADSSLPFCIVHSLPGKPPYVIKYFSEKDDPEKMLAQIFEGDNKNGDVLKKIDAQNAAAEAFRLKQQMDENLEAADKFHFLATNRSKNVVRWRDTTGKIVKLDSNRRRMK